MEDCGKCEPKRDPVAHEIMNYLDRLAGQAEKTCSRVAERLHNVCIAERPEACGAEINKEREYPPLFGDMRERLRTIDYALRRVNDVIDRCEV